MRITLILTALSLPLWFAGTARAETKQVETFNGWTLYSNKDGNSPLCFVLSSPTSTEPAGAKRSPVHFYVSAWPREGVRSEISVKNGYSFRKGSEVTVTVGSDVFKLFTQDERAYVNDPIEELKLLEAMKKGSTMVVEGVSERGTATKDSYSLMGITKAVQSLATGCE